MPSSHLILCRPILLPPIPPNIRVFSNESTLHMRWPKYWSFSFSIIPSKTTRTDLLQNGLVVCPCSPRDSQESSPTPPKTSILWHSAFFTVQLSHPYMTTGNTIAFTRQTFVGKIISLLLNMQSVLVITFLPRSKCLLSSWLQSPPAVILEPTKIKSDTVSILLFLHFFSMGMVLIPVSCTMSRTSVHSSSGTLSIRSSPLNLFLTSTV